MDQASFLRELMNKSQRVKTNTFSLLCSSDFPDVEGVSLQFVRDFTQQTGRLSTILGLSTKTVPHTMPMEYCLDNADVLKEAVVKMNPKLQVGTGNLAFVSAIRQNQSQLKQFIKAIQTMEKQSDTLFYLAGEGLTTTSLNLTLLTNKVIFFLQPTHQSMKELAQLLKLFTKTKKNQQIGVVLVANNSIEFQEHLNKIQEYCWHTFKYYIEPIGYCTDSHPTTFEAVGYEFVLEKNEITTLSEALEQLMG